MSIKSYTPPHKRFSPSRKFNGRALIQALYNTPEWSSYRAQFLAANPKCYSCGQKSNVCDHMIPHKGDLLLFWKEDNYLPLCDSCHSIVTGIFDRDKVPKPLSMKLEWMAKNRARNGVDTFSVKIVPLPKEIAAKFIAPDLERIIEKMKSQK